VLLAGPTYDRIRDRVRVEPRGSASLKGRAAAVDVYELRQVHD
jgi:class 3 adenylate cyclase